MEKIKIITFLDRKTMNSKMKEGETYFLTEVTDDKNRKLVAFGDWAKDWKAGDEIDVIVGPVNKWTNRSGFEEISYKVSNPNAKSKGSGGNWGVKAATPTIVDAYKIAAILAPTLYANKKERIKLEDISLLANAVKVKLDNATPAPVIEPTPAPAVEAAKPTPEIDVASDSNLEDDDSPF